MVAQRSTAASGASSASRRAGLADRLATLARHLRGVSDVGTAVDEVVRTALDLIPSAAHASISLVEADGLVESRAATGELPRLVDALQTDLGQGPCLDAAFWHRVVRVPDLSREERWPEFSALAWDAGARSMLCVQFFVQGRELGSLNLYGREVGDFGEECEEVALLVATHAAIALAEARDLRGLNSALVSRDVIGQAKGVLMERYRLSGHEAFLLLSQAASRRRARLIDVAEELTSTGTIAAVGPSSSAVEDAPDRYPAPIRSTTWAD